MALDWLLDAAGDELKRAAEGYVRRRTRRAFDAFTGDAAVRDPVTAVASLPGSPDGLALEQREDALRDYLAQETIQVAVLGSPGTGKTALCARICDLRRRPTYVLGIDQGVLDRAGVGSGVGGWMRSIAPAQLGQVPNGSDVLIDDASQVLGNDDYGSEVARTFQQMTENRRHWALGIVLNCQTGRAVNAYALTCEVLALKPGAAFFPELERDGMAQLLREADAAYRGMSAEDVKHTALVYRKWPTLRGPVRYRYPAWYSTEFSVNKRRRRVGTPLQLDDTSDEPDGEG